MNYKSHIGQDKWVDVTYGEKTGGYFLDFGAFDGVLTSNTFTLEKECGWRGICVEPNPSFFPVLCQHRTSILINCALWKESRLQLPFIDAHGLSSLAATAKNDINAERRQEATKRRILVDTINPNELLERFNAPQFIEYMSLDVEGCELDVLKTIDFQHYNIGLMSIEHNHQQQRSARNYLGQFGYKVIENRNDDFFYRDDVHYDNDPAMVSEEIYRSWRIQG